jgi:hypothetical protein
MPKHNEFRFTESSEFQDGHFGKYFMNRGYKIDFLPYEVTLFEYATKIKEMKSNRYINLGGTKMVSIDFGFMFPSSTYFVNVNMLFEFSSLGQVIPTRFEATPFKLSSFSPAGDN